MGFPLHSFQERSDNKLYRLQTPQSPLVRPVMYDHYNMDNYPIGTNAVVAVISYTGYDMEDAMVRALVAIVTYRQFYHREEQVNRTGSTTLQYTRC